MEKIVRIEFIYIYVDEEKETLGETGEGRIVYNQNRNFFKENPVFKKIACISCERDFQLCGAENPWNYHWYIKNEVKKRENYKHICNIYINLEKINFDNVSER